MHLQNAAKLKVAQACIYGSSHKVSLLAPPIIIIMLFCKAPRRALHQFLGGCMLHHCVLAVSYGNYCVSSPRQGVKLSHKVEHNQLPWNSICVSVWSRSSDYSHDVDDVSIHGLAI